MARTIIDLDETKLEIIMRRYKVRTAAEAVDLALTDLAERPLSIDEALDLYGRLDLGNVPTGPAPR